MPSRAKRIAPVGYKYCPKCHHLRNLKDFAGGYCSSCQSEYGKTYRQDTLPILIDNIRQEAYEAYGGAVCCRCGTTDPLVLTIFPRGGKGERALLYQLRKNHWPKGYKVTCRNCEVYLRQTDF